MIGAAAKMANAAEGHPAGCAGGAGGKGVDGEEEGGLGEGLLMGRMRDSRGVRGADADGVRMEEVMGRGGSK